MATSETDPDQAAVDRTIVTCVLPLVYAAMDDLIDAAGDRAPKELLLRCKQLLPSNRRHSFAKRG